MPTEKKKQFTPPYGQSIPRGRKTEETLPVSVLDAMDYSKSTSRKPVTKKGREIMETKKKGISPYVYLAIIVLSYLTAGFCQYRLQPILTYLMQGMSIDEGKAGVLVSALSILSIFLAMPFGVMMGKVGPRKTGTPPAAGWFFPIPGHQ